MLIFIERNAKHVGIYDLLYNKPPGIELVKVPVLPP
jgi:hypothetical protein